MIMRQVGLLCRKFCSDGERGQATGESESTDGNQEVRRAYEVRLDGVVLERSSSGAPTTMVREILSTTTSVSTELGIREASTTLA